MCLAIPGKITEINDDEAVVDYGAEKRTANNSLVNAKVGDYVIISGKFIVQVVPEEEAIKALETWKKAI